MSWAGIRAQQTYAVRAPVLRGIEWQWLGRTTLEAHPTGVGVAILAVVLPIAFLAVRAADREASVGGTHAQHGVRPATPASFTTSSRICPAAPFDEGCGRGTVRTRLLQRMTRRHSHRAAAAHCRDSLSGRHEHVRSHPGRPVSLDLLPNRTWSLSRCSVYDGAWHTSTDVCWKNALDGQTPSHPVSCVSSQDAKRFAGWLSSRTHHLYRLPSASRWNTRHAADSVVARPWSDDKEPAPTPTLRIRPLNRRYPGWTSPSLCRITMYVPEPRIICPQRPSLVRHVRQTYSSGSRTAGPEIPT